MPTALCTSKKQKTKKTLIANEGDSTLKDIKLAYISKLRFRNKAPILRQKAWKANKKKRKKERKERKNRRRVVTQS